MHKYPLVELERTPRRKKSCRYYLSATVIPSPGNVTNRTEGLDADVSGPVRSALKNALQFATQEQICEKMKRGQEAECGPADARSDMAHRLLW